VYSLHLRIFVYMLFSSARSWLEWYSLEEGCRRWHSESRQSTLLPCRSCTSCI